MEEIEVGEYIRTNEGLITKITDIKTEEYEDGTSEIFIETELNPGYLDYTIEDITKHSKQPIGLIEVGDFVNGYKVDEVRITCFNTIIFIDDYKKELTENQIKTILTKEQYEANCYKVGGNNETSNDKLYETRKK